MQEKRLKYKSQPIEEDTAEGVNSFLVQEFLMKNYFSIKNLYGP